MNYTEAKLSFNQRICQKDYQFCIISALILLFLVAIGVWLRVRNLGDLSLIVDEGIQALAVRGILENGLPKVDSGYVYTRALPFLYIQALVVKLFELNPVWLRLPAVIFGVGTIISSYILGRNLFGRNVGLLAAAVIAFSVWEIELSRYARSYTAFQFMYLVATICFYKGFMRDECNYRFWFILTAFLAFSTHALSQMLLCLFLIPLISPAFTIFRKLIFCLWGIGLAGLLKIYRILIGVFKKFEDPSLLQIPGDGTNVAPSILHKIRGVVGLPSIYLPDLKFFSQTMQQHPLTFASLFMIAGISTVYLIYRGFQKDCLWKIMLALGMVWVAFFHQFGIVMVLLALYLILFIRDYKDLWDPSLLAVYSVNAIYLIIWFVIIYCSPGVSLKQVVVALFGFPNFGNYFMFWLIKGWPLLTAVFAIGCIFLLNSFISKPDEKTALFVLGAIFIPALMASFFKSYHESRYIFHLYPLIVIVFSMVLISAISYILTNLPLKRKPTQLLVTSALILTILFISQDANPLHAWSISNRTYQSARDPFRSIISWKPYAGFHQDHRSASLFVKNQLKTGDKIVVIGPIHMIGLYHYYTGMVDYTVAPTKTTTYYGLKKKGKLINYLTGSEIIGGLTEFKKFIDEQSQGIWLLGDYLLLIEDNSFYSKSMKEYIRSLSRNPEYIGLDNKTFAVKLK